MATFKSNRSRNRRQLSIESLEERQMMAADIGLVDVSEGGETIRELQIEGTAQADVVEVQQIGSMLQVTVDGVQHDFAADNVDRILIQWKRRRRRVS